MGIPLRPDPSALRAMERRSFNRAVTALETKQKKLEQFPSRLNREGFPNQLGCDSSCMLVEEASMHGPSAIVGSSQTCCRRRR